MVTKLICVGILTGARGLRGEVRIKSFTDEAADIAAYGPLTDESGVRTFQLSVSGLVKNHVVARIEGIDDRDAALALKGTRLYLAREAFPETPRDEYYHVDLIGLSAAQKDADGGPDEVFGTVTAVHDFGAGDILEIDRGGGETIMVPFTRAVVPEVDLAGGSLVIVPPAGIVVDEAEPKRRQPSGAARPVAARKRESGKAGHANADHGVGRADQGKRGRP
ncbi:MAG TPA: ribosome maturation factor RimM [Rhodospirillales bacterium]|jgi:16S rRNA processing protein RimM|nr:ribosome maturation factor RimM [Rhodospirillales bacterium]HJO70077.1 ribosome maturation factor RimM [Rhodospirillales bacterium]